MLYCMNDGRYVGTVPRYRTPFVEFECVGLWYAVPRMYSEYSESTPYSEYCMSPKNGLG